METETRVNEVTEAILDEHTTVSRWRLRHCGGQEYSTEGSYTRKDIEVFINTEAWKIVGREYGSPI